MRVEHGEHWLVFKEVDKLTSGDADDWEEAAGLEFTVPEQPEGQELTGADLVGLARASLKMTPAKIAAQRNKLFEILVTDWSLGIPLPREDPASVRQMPLALRFAAENELEPYMTAMRRAPGPKATTRSSSNGSSRAGARRSRPASTGAPSETS